MLYDPHASHLASDAVKQFFQKKFPYHRQQRYPEHEWRYLRRVFGFWKIAAPALAVALLIALPIPYTWLLAQLHRALLPAFLPDGARFVPPDWRSFVLTGGPLGLATLGRVLEGIQRLALGPRYAAFEDYYNASQGYDNRQAERFVMRWVWPVVLVSLYASFGQWLVVGRSEMHLKRFFDLKPTCINLKDVAAVRHTHQYYKPEKHQAFPSGRTELILKSGGVLKVNYYMSDMADYAVYQQAIAVQTGLPVDTVAFESR